MPSRAPRCCGYCDDIHQPGERCPKVVARDAARKASFDKKRPSARARGYDKAWETEAKAFLSLEQNKTCARCRTAKATVVMHIQSIRARPDLRMQRANWRPGCQRCNAIEAAQERHSKRGS